MQIEVPSDKYEETVQAIERRIKRGEVPNVTNPDEAKNIAKAGTIEFIIYDAANGLIIATSAFGISSVLSFAVSIWNGKEFDETIKIATYTGLKVGRVTFISAVLAGQLSKAGLNSALIVSSETIVEIMGPKASACMVRQQ